jgi:hypothetical protein
MKLGTFNRWFAGRGPKVIADLKTLNLGSQDRWFAGRPSIIQHQQLTGYFDSAVYSIINSLEDAVADKSGCDVDPVNDYLFTIRNNGVYIRKFTLGLSYYNQSSALGSPFNDSEDICYTGGSHPDGDWAVINEQPYGSSKLLLFDYAPGDTGTPDPIVEYDMSDITGENPGSGYGTEGVAYDPVRDKFYVNMQSMAIGGLWEVDIEAGPLTVRKMFDWSTITAQGYGDSTWLASSICHGRRIGLPNSIFVLINNSGFTANKIIEVTYDGTVLSSMDGPGNKAEGFCFYPSAPYDMFMVSDNSTGATAWRYSTESESYPRFKALLGVGI